jgi:hypothetical protein
VLFNKVYKLTLPFAVVLPLHTMAQLALEISAEIASQLDFVPSMVSDVPLVLLQVF